MSYLGLDVGTSRTKAVAYDGTFGVLAENSTTLERLTPRLGWYEIDAAELCRTVRRVVAECARQCKADPIRWISCSVFGGGITAIDSKLQPLHNIISTTDNRAQAQAEDWTARFGRQRTYRITGTTTHPSLMLPKVLWLKKHLHSANQVAWFVTAAELVQAALGVPPKMDLATASTTMLLDIARGRWSAEILEAAQIPLEQLPPLIGSGEVISEIPDEVCSELGLARGCALVAGGHDQQVCAFGAGLLEPGRATDSLGTVECITTLFKEPVLRDDLLENNFSNLLHVHGKLIATLAYNFSSGDLFQWVRRTLFAGESSFAAMFARLPQRPARVLALPHFAGSGTPHLDARSKGMFVGLTFQTTPEEILRGMVDSANYEMRLNLEVWRRNGIVFDSLRAYGKGATSDVLLQIKADILGVEVHRLNVTETGCFGAALLAARGAEPEFPVAETIKRVVGVEKSFAPRAEFAEEHDCAYRLYCKLYPQMREVLHEL
ncbi:MAG: FGGY family carbohydrate kinase [Verrucomicrobiae bacterium]|nr:FGGY family carbohydrate kinase [Verrucomicrobiae bacterium]